MKKNGSMSGYAKKIARQAKEASVGIANVSSYVKNNILACAAELLRKRQDQIVAENRKDLAAAKKQGLSAAMLDRLALNEKRISDMAASIESVMGLADPVGEVLGRWARPNGLQISKVRVPLGVILIIYEARPNVTQECASLCLKSGNSVILKGGKEAFYSNRAISRVFQEALRENGVSEHCVEFVDNTDRKAVDELLKLHEDIHLVIPRGGESLIRKVASSTRIPVIKHYKGVCHVYVDKDADLAMAVSIAFNAKCQRPSVCNAMETLLVHKDVAAEFLPALAIKLAEVKCEIRGCLRTRKILPQSKKAKERDWAEEYLDLILAVRVVDSVEEAMEHIRRYGSAHTDAVVTRNKATADRFIRYVDSSSVMVNTSTRFSDGFQYGFGAEIGISTDKIHARGPMGLEGLTSYKYVVEGSGQLRM